MCARPPVHALIRRPHGWCALQFTSKQLSAIGQAYSALNDANSVGNAVKVPESVQ